MWEVEKFFKKLLVLLLLTKQWSLTLWGKEDEKSHVLKIQLFAFLKYNYSFSL